MRFEKNGICGRGRGSIAGADAKEVILDLR